MAQVNAEFGDHRLLDMAETDVSLMFFELTT
jgi:hypothetical protein